MLMDDWNMVSSDTFVRYTYGKYEIEMTVPNDVRLYIDGQDRRQPVRFSSLTFAINHVHEIINEQNAKIIEEWTKSRLSI